MRLTLLGTGDARQVPVYGCDCPACRNARADAGLRRRPCSALLECAGQRWLIDSGLVDLCERFPPHSLDGILQTHYHADHAQGLLHLRWGQGLVIPVHGPADPEGLADLYKHPGILDFSQPFGAFERRQWGALAATALPLVHSKPTFGYLLEGLPRRERYGAWPTSPIPSGCRRTAPRDCSRRRWTCWCWTARCRRRSGRRATTTTSRRHWSASTRCVPGGPC